MSEPLFPLAGCKLEITVEDGYLKAYATPQGRPRDEVFDGVRKLVEDYLEANRILDAERTP